MGAVLTSVVWQVRRSDFFSVGMADLYKSVTIFGNFMKRLSPIAIRFLSVTFINFQHQHPTTAIYQMVGLFVFMVFSVLLLALLNVARHYLLGQ